MILGLVCAHSRSTGCPDKSLRRLGGRNLIQIAIDKARDSGVVDKVALVTDYPAHVADGYDLYIPRDLTDESCSPRVAKWILWRYATNAWTGREPLTGVVDIDVSRPLTTPGDVSSVVGEWKPGAFPVLAVGESKKHPAFDVYMGTPLKPALYGGSEIASRQDLRETWSRAYVHGGITAMNAGDLWVYEGMFAAGLRPVEIPYAHCFDIDSELDWEIVKDRWRRTHLRSMAPAVAGSAR